MKITLFTSNQPRHVGLINKLSKISKKIYVIQECHTISPGVNSGLIKKTPIMKTYFENVLKAENKYFGSVHFLRSNVLNLSISSGDLNNLSQSILQEALKSDLYIVFGCSYIKGWLVEFLIKNNAINLHMGVSPYYRGSACNFWALYDKNQIMLVQLFINYLEELMMVIFYFIQCQF